MKKIAFVLMLVAFIGCAAVSSNTVPEGKTDDNWPADEKYCIEKSGMVTGFFAQNPIGLAINMGRNGAHKRYEQCLRDLGWLK